MTKPFANRAAAGRTLAALLTRFAGRPDVVVLGLPRGGVPVAFEVAAALGAPLDVFLVRKLGAPGRRELAMGAVASGGLVVLNDALVRALGVSDRAVRRAVEAESQELARREQLYRAGGRPVEVRGRTVLLVDDGLATGASMLAASRAIAQEAPARVVVAIPVAAPETCELLRREVDEVVCALAPEPFHAVGLWYDDFSQTTDDEVRALLAAHATAANAPPPEAEARAQH